MNILFRADGSSKIGMGHMVRSMALADEFRKRGHIIYFVVKEDEYAKKLVEQHGVELLPYIENDNYPLISDMLDKYGIELMVSDVDEYSARFFSFLREKDVYSVQLDIHRKMNLSVDLLVNGGIYAKELEEAASRESQKSLLGPEYNLLRKEFSKVEVKKDFSTVKNILITMGATDINDLTEGVTMACLDEFPEAIFHIVLGSDKKPFINQALYDHPSVKLHYKTPYMHKLMELADLALCSGGITIYELAACGTPAITITQAENQIRQSLIFASAGANLYYGRAEAFDIDLLKKLLMKVKDPLVRRKLSISSRKLIDGKGTERVADYILSILAS